MTDYRILTKGHVLFKVEVRKAPDYLWKNLVGDFTFQHSLEESKALIEKHRRQEAINELEWKEVEVGR